MVFLGWDENRKQQKLHFLIFVYMSGLVVYYYLFLIVCVFQSLCYLQVFSLTNRVQIFYNLKDLSTKDNELRK